MHRRFNGVVFACLMAVPASVASAGPLPAGNPLTGAVPQSPVAVEVVDVIRIPDSDGKAPRLEWLTHADDGTGRLFVGDQRGVIWTFTPGDAAPTPLLDLAAALPGFRFVGPQQGVRGFAFHPGGGYLYTASSTDPTSGGNHDSVVHEWVLTGSGEVDMGVLPREVLRVSQPYADHNIGQISFNPLATPGHPDHGRLYIAMGDGGNQWPPVPIDPLGHGQSGASLLGSILRIDPLAGSGPGYAAPNDNPFVGDADHDPAVWATGLRNPHRFTWDAATGTMLLVDVGQANIEEVNLGIAGANYGWAAREGTFTVADGNTHPSTVEPLPADHANDPFTYPVAQYDHDPYDANDGSSWAIVGGPVVRGGAIAGLEGHYLFGDFSKNHGPIFAVAIEDLIARDALGDALDLHDGRLAPFAELVLTRDGQLVTLLELIRAESGNPLLARTDLRFGSGPDGAVYLLNKHDGMVRQLVPEPALASLLLVALMLQRRCPCRWA